MVITDLSHIFDNKIQNALSIAASDAPRYVHHDNPEDCVGDYSKIAAKVISFAQESCLPTRCWQIPKSKARVGLKTICRETCSDILVKNKLAQSETGADGFAISIIPFPPDPGIAGTSNVFNEQGNVYG